MTKEHNHDSKMKRLEPFQREVCGQPQDSDIRLALRRLPEIQPEIDVWDALNARLSDRPPEPPPEAGETRPPQPALLNPGKRLWHWISATPLRLSLPGYATAASVFLVALSLVLMWRPVPPHQQQESGVGIHESAGASIVSGRVDDVTELMTRSQRLEQSLRRTRPDEFVWNTTRQALVYRISDVDQRLNQMGVHSDAYSPEYKALLQRRLALMDSLLQVQQSSRVTVF